MRRYIIPTRLRSVFIAAVAVAFLPAAATAADPVAYLPDRTMLVVSFNVQQFLESPLIREGGNFKPFVKDAVRALEGFGVDPTKDADRVHLAVGEQLRASSMLMLFQGRFDADKVQKRLKDRAKDRKADIEVLDEGGATVFQCRLPAPPPNARVALPGQFYMTVLDGTTIALGIDRAAVTEVLAKKAGRRKSDVKPRILELVGRIDAKETVSFVFVPPADFLTGGPMNGLTTMTGGLTVTDGIRTDIRLDAKDAESAKLLADNVRDGLGKVREILPGLATLQLGLDRKDQDVIREMLESFKVTTRADGVTIAGAIPKDQIDKIGRK